MNNSTYWANRFKALEDRQYRKSAAFVEGLKAKFDYADDELETNLYKWYSKLMKNTDAPSLNDAKKLLKEDELKEFHWTLEQYEKYAKEHGLDPEWIKKLENASARKHISRYEQIQLQMRQIEEKLYAEYNNECYGYLGELVEDSYYHTAYEIEKGTGIGIDLHKLDRDTVEKYLAHPWCQDGKVFSDRIWQRKDELVRTLDQELTRQLITGADPQKAIDAISDKFDVSKRQAGTLVMTESAAIASEASKDSMKNLGVEEYEILATLDSHTSEICQEMDGQHFRMSEYNPGLTAPPFHPNCRSTTIPYFDDEFITGETRAARDKNDKDYERVPADMKYGEWKKQYVDKPEEKKESLSEKIREKIKSFFKKEKKDDTIKEKAEEKPKKRRGQIGTGYPGKIPDDALEEFNRKGLEQIKADTGYSDEEAKEFQEAIQKYFGGDYEGIETSPDSETTKTIIEGLEKMPTYEGSISRGICLNNDKVSEFSKLKPGDSVPKKGVIESWSSDNVVAISYASVGKSVDQSSVIFECVENKTGVGTQHLSKFGAREAEVTVANPNYEVVEVITESKYDYLSKNKDLLYFPDDLIEEEQALREAVVCIVKVKEKN